MLREMYDQFVFGEVVEIERVIRGTSPYLKFAFKSARCIMIAEFSPITPLTCIQNPRRVSLN